MVEPQSSKLITRVRFSSPAPDLLNADTVVPFTETGVPRTAAARSHTTLDRYGHDHPAPALTIVKSVASDPPLPRSSAWWVDGSRQQCSRSSRPGRDPRCRDLGDPGGWTALIISTAEVRHHTIAYGLGRTLRSGRPLGMESYPGGRD